MVGGEERDGKRNEEEEVVSLFKDSRYIDIYYAFQTLHCLVGKKNFIIEHDAAYASCLSTKNLARMLATD